MKYIIRTMFITVGLYLCTVGQVFAVLTCSVPPVHLSGSITVTLSRYGENSAIPQGTKTMSRPFIMTCNNSDYVPDPSVYWNLSLSSVPVESLQGLERSTDIAGNPAWLLGRDTAESNNGLAIEPYIINNNDSSFKQYLKNVADGGPVSGFHEDIYGSGRSGQGVESGYTGAVGFDVVTSNNNSWSIPSGVTTDSNSYNFSHVMIRVAGASQIGAPGFGRDYSNNIDLLYIDNLTVNYLFSSCGIHSKQGSEVHWSNLGKAEIRNGIAPTKPYSLSLICGNASDAPSKVNITFSATNGFADAAKGIVNTNRDHLGLQLSWANPALGPLILDQVNSSTLAGVGDYTVLAKPVKVGAPTDAILGGDFDTSVTMTIEFP